jgi:hypothetical protein
MKPHTSSHVRVEATREVGFDQRPGMIRNIMPPIGRNGIVFYAIYYAEKEIADQLLSRDDTI